MIVVNYFQGMHGSCIGAVELAFIYNTDGISGKHTVAAFQRCLRNIKSIRFFIAQERDLIAGKILKYMNDFGSCAFKSMILKEDLAPSVKASLEKADTALQSYSETDPTVPAWAKTPTKPTYTAAEVGALSLDDANNNFAKKSDISTVYKWKGSKDTYDQLPTEGNSVGDIWNVKDTNMNYGWTEDGTWDPLGSPVEISPITNEAIDSIVAGT